MTLWKACFDFVHTIGTVTNYDLIPYQNLILSITTILSIDKEGLPVFRFGFYFKIITYLGFSSKLYSIRFLHFAASYEYR